MRWPRSSVRVPERRVQQARQALPALVKAGQLALAIPAPLSHPVALLPEASLIRFVYSLLPELPLVSVITPCYNYCDNYLPETIASVSAQNYRNIEHLILHCNCGTDKPVYLPAARNRLVAEARGEYILPLDADDLFTPEAVNEMVKYIGVVDIVSCQQREFG